MLHCGLLTLILFALAYLTRLVVWRQDKARLKINKLGGSSDCHLLPRFRVIIHAPTLTQSEATDPPRFYFINYFIWRRSCGGRNRSILR